MKLLVFALTIVLSQNILADNRILLSLLEKMDANDSYKVLLDKCPADIYRKSKVSYKNHTRYCSENIDACMSSCENGDANYCSSLAINLQGYGFGNSHSEILFSKSCELGLASACTNRASGLIKYSGEKYSECAVKTFELTCSSDDAWGCTMYGAFLAQGKGGNKDLNKALNVLEGGCINGLEDPACQNAKNIISQIKSVLSQDKSDK